MNTQANLEGIAIVASQQPGLATFSNYDELKGLLQSAHDAYMAIDYAESPLDVAEANLKVLKVTATERQMLEIMGELELASLDVEVLEDGMPQPMREIASPDFADCVCFDTENTGTFGIAWGDAEVEITEISAVLGGRSLA